MLIHHLQNEFQARRKKNPRYSLRAFARSIKTDPSTLAKLLKRSRKVTPTQALRIVQALDMDLAMKSTLLLAVLEGRSGPPPDGERFRDVDLSAEGMEHWEFYAVLSLLELETTKHSVPWIAKRLGTSEERVAKCIRGLEKFRYIEKDGKRWKIATPQLTNPPPQGKPNPVLQNVQREYIEIATRAIHHPIDTRDLSGSTIAMCSQKLPEAWRRIREFRRALADYLADGPKDSVYRINIQLFRLDHGDESGLGSS